jgi:hypothetical protein
LALTGYNFGTTLQFCLRFPILTDLNTRNKSYSNAYA